MTARALLAAGILAATLGAPVSVPGQAGRPPASGPAPGRGQPVTVNADRMEHYGKESLVVFSGKIVARQDNSVQYADRMEVYLDEKGERIVRTVSTGNVRIVTKDCRTGTAKRAEYFDLEQRMVLSGDARVWQGDRLVTGETITIFLSQDHSVVQGGGQERVKAVFYAKDANANEPSAAPRPTAGTDRSGCEP